jgi:hypothetical protein
MEWAHRSHNLPLNKKPSLRRNERKMKTKILLPLLAVALVALTVNPVIADIIEGEGESGFYWVQIYRTTDWLMGPAGYYERDVVVVYEAINTWKYEVDTVSGDVLYELEQIGTAKVYEEGYGTPITDSWGRSGLQGSFIEELDFFAEEEWFDVGGDASTWDGVSPYPPVWWSSNMEQYGYEWKIYEEGVRASTIYEYTLTAEYGVWELFWESGEYSGGFTYPP